MHPNPTLSPFEPMNPVKRKRARTFSFCTSGQEADLFHQTIFTAASVSLMAMLRYDPRSIVDVNKFRDILDPAYRGIAKILRHSNKLPHCDPRCLRQLSVNLQPALGYYVITVDYLHPDNQLQLFHIKILPSDGQTCFLRLITRYVGTNQSIDLEKLKTL